MLEYDYIDDAKLFEEFLAFSRGKIAGLRVVYKDELSPLLRFLLPRGRVFSIGKSIYFPSRKYVKENSVRSFKILSAEVIKMSDKIEKPIAYRLMYWFPEWLSLLAPLSALTIYNLFFALFAVLLIFLGNPWEASIRAELAMRYYGTFVFIDIVRHGHLLDSTKKWIVDEMCGVGTVWSLKSRGKAEAMVMRYASLTYSIDAIKNPVSIFHHSTFYIVIHKLLTGEDRFGTD